MADWEEIVGFFGIIIFFLFVPAIIAVIIGGGISAIASYMTGMITSGLIFLLTLIFGSLIVIIGFISAPYFASIGQPKIARWISYFGVLLIMFSFVYLEVGILSSVIGESIKKGNAIFMPCDNFRGKSLLDMASCVLIGYYPSGNKLASAFAYYSIYLFGVVFPIIVIVLIFTDAVENSGIISRPLYAKLIGIGLGMMAWRGFIITRLIFVLDFGATGIALLLINLLFFGIIFNRIKLFFRTYQQLEDVIETRIEYKTWRPILEREIRAASVSAQSMRRLAADEVFLGRLQDAVGTTAARAIADEMLSVQDSRQAAALADKIIRRLKSS